MSTAEQSVLRLAGGWDSVLEGEARAALEQSALAAYLGKQRWFGGKARRIAAVRIVDTAKLPQVRTLLLLVRVEYADHGSDLYFLPLATLPEFQGEADLVVARLAGPEGSAVLVDGLASPDVCQALLTAVARGEAIVGQHGTIRGQATPSFAEVRGLPHVDLPAQLGPATSSNSLVFYDERLLLKLFRRLEAGVNPDFEIGRFLTERAGFERTPKMAGALEYFQTGAEVITLAVLQQFIPGAIDGWKHALGELAGYFERAAARPAPQRGGEGQSLLELAHEEPDAAAAAAIDGYLRDAATLGRRSAEMHRALASDQRDPAFAPEPLAEADLDAILADVRQQAREALDTLRANQDQLPAEIGADAQQFLDEAPAALARLEADEGSVPAAAKTRCHGDYHLGQVLRVADDFVLLDFEGEPKRSIEERCAKQSPLRDVAGMLRSLDYAAYAGLFAFTQDRPHDFARLEPWAEVWQRWTSAAFLREYLTTAAGAAFLPAEAEQTQRLLRLFMLGKAFYELVYELNNRPDWVRIPLRGLLALLREPAAAATR